MDLLWNGGIGTYVKAAGETDAEVGDRSNDRVRLNAAQLRCRVIGEGGNLGLTQAARIEYALAGGRVNADFVDNAGGVNTSDHEVNLKILLGSALDAGLLDVAARDQLLASCAEEVVESILQDNRSQTLAISVAEHQAPFLLDRHEHVIGNLELLTGLDRARENLPTTQDIAQRRARGIGLVRPEIAVLLAHAKNLTRGVIADSEMATDTSMLDVLFGYFPARLRERFADQIRGHPLAREIIATRVANDLLNRVGPGFMYRVEDRTGSTVAQAVRACVVVRDVFGLEQVWDQVEPLPPVVATPVRHGLEDTFEHNVCWLLRRRPEVVDIGTERDYLSPNVRRLRRWLEQQRGEPAGTNLRAQVRALVAQGVSEELARICCAIGLLLPALDLASTAMQEGCDVTDLAEQYFVVGERLELGWMAEMLPVGPADSHWEQLAKAALRDEMCALQVTLAADSLRAGGADPWFSRNTQVLDRAHASYTDLATAGGSDAAVLAVGVQVLRDIAHAATGH